MEPEQGLAPQQLPSKQKVAAASAAALLGAAVILVTVVLPAEYGIDPLGTGARFGLLAISRPAPTESIAPAPGANEFTPVEKGAAAYYGAEYNIDTAEFVLDPYEYVEYKYHLEKGASMLFAWAATATVIHDFHGDPDADPKNVTSYDKRDAREANGSFVAPFTGIHGWYWENPGGDRIIVKVTSAGFYNAAMEIRFDGTRKRHEVRRSNEAALEPK